MKTVKKVIVLTIAFGSAIMANAQDKIMKKNGELVDSKILIIDNSAVTFKKYNNIDGPNYKLDVTEIDKIVFENGRTQIFNQNEPKQYQPSTNTPTVEVTSAPKVITPTKKNVFVFAPMQISTPSPNSLGLGLHYERILDESGIVAFYLPVAFSPAAKDNSGSTTEGLKFGDMVWTYPGLKIYPSGYNKVFNYALGASFVYGTGKMTRTTTDYNMVYNPNFIYTPTSITTDCKVYGMMLHNSININVKSLCLGFEGGLGFPYSFSSVSISDGPILQLKFFGGVRF